MKPIRFSESKNTKLKRERGISFEEIIRVAKDEGIIDILDNPNKKRYSNQKVFLIAINDYIYVVPFIENEHEIFLKTIYKSRKHTKRYLKKK